MIEYFTGDVQDYLDRRHRTAGVDESRRAAARVRKLGNKSFSIALHALRAKSRITQTEAARRIGVAKGTYHNWELGRFIPNGYYIPIIAAAFGCPIADLYLEEAGPDGQ